MAFCAIGFCRFMDATSQQLLDRYKRAVSRADEAFACLRRASGPFIRHAVQELVVSMRAGIDVNALRAEETKEKDSVRARAARAIQTLARYGFTLEREPLRSLVEAVAEICVLAPRVRAMDPQRRDETASTREIGPNGRPCQTPGHAFAARTGNALRAWGERASGSLELFAEPAPYNPFLDPGGLAAIEIRTAVDPAGVDRVTMERARPVLDTLEESGSGVVIDRLSSLEFELIGQALSEWRRRGVLDATQDARLQQRLQLRFSGSEALRTTERRLRDERPLSRHEADLLLAELDHAHKRGALTPGDYEDAWDRVDWRERQDCGDPRRLAILQPRVQRKIAQAVINEALARAIERPWTASALHLWVFADGDFTLTLGRASHSSKRAVACGKLPTGLLNVGDRCVTLVTARIARAVEIDRVALGLAQSATDVMLGQVR